MSNQLTLRFSGNHRSQVLVSEIASKGAKKGRGGGGGGGDGGGGGGGFDEEGMPLEEEGAVSARFSQLSCVLLRVSGGGGRGGGGD